MTPPIATQPGEAYADDADMQATSGEALAPNVDPATGKRLPTFRVKACCVLQNTCVRDDGLFRLDPDGKFNPDEEPRAICAVQPRTEAELEVFRHHARECPVSAIEEIPPAE